MKLMTAHIIERGHGGGGWRSEDLFKARLLANSVRRPWGTLEASPEQRWTTRNSLSVDERQNMWQELKSRRAQVREASGIGLEVSLSHYAQAEVDRDAASPVLAELGNYQVKRRRYTPVI